MNIHAAAMEYDWCLPIIERLQPSHVFMSFLRAGKPAIRNLRKARALGISVIVDSGAHSFFSASGGTIKAATNVSRSAISEPPSKFFARYLAFMREFQDEVDFFVELDIGEIVGQGTVVDWRRRIEKAGIAHKVLPVYHPKCNGQDEFFNIATNWPSAYVGVEGIRGKAATIDYTAFTLRCYDAGVRVHGFAMVNQKWLQRAPFYSVDSAGWKSVYMYGGMSQVHTEGPTVKSFRPSVAAPNELARLVKYGAAPSKVVGKQGTDADSVCACAVLPLRGLRHLARQTTQLWRARGIDWDKQLAAVHGSHKKRNKDKAKP